ncbi:GNAT family N-acetyltransferase [Bacillus safensis]|uniref:N-acetyltransferase domain-containing protein n=1 Tax=Bacillus safensis TaxID=561879 RepID=A0A1L6ZK02_BACIA|nr:GNAT family N-acetyltransferase [Bacillus safensis]APT46856.1 hypothetical protein BSA145_13935 [Bacillus safensis]
MKNANSIFTRTNRVVIRQFDRQDIEAFYQYQANPTIAKFQSWENYTYEDAESFVNINIEFIYKKGKSKAVFIDQLKQFFMN